MAAAASRARTPPRSIARPRTWPDTWPRTWWPRASPTGSSSRWPTPSAPPIPSRWPLTRSAPSGSTRSGSSASCGTRSTSGRPRSSASSTSAGRSTRRRRPTVTSAARSSPGRRPTAPTSSAARSTNPSTDERILSGPVDICVDRAVLSLDRPFTYGLDEGLAAGIGSLVQVPFHGRLVRGWVLGSSEDVPDRMLQVRNAVSPVRFFDPSMLEVLRWVSERYVAPLASVIARSYPPRVASEETIASVPHRSSAPVLRPDPARILPAYRAGSEMLGALQAGAGAFVVRPAPEVARHRSRRVSGRGGDPPSRVRADGGPRPPLRLPGEPRRPSRGALALLPRPRRGAGPGPALQCRLCDGSPVPIWGGRDVGGRGGGPSRPGMAAGRGGPARPGGTSPPPGLGAEAGGPGVPVPATARLRRRARVSRVRGAGRLRCLWWGAPVTSGGGPMHRVRSERRVRQLRGRRLRHHPGRGRARGGVGPGGGPGGGPPDRLGRFPRASRERRSNGGGRGGGEGLRSPPPGPGRHPRCRPGGPAAGPCGPGACSGHVDGGGGLGPPLRSRDRADPPPGRPRGPVPRLGEPPSLPPERAAPPGRRGLPRRLAGVPRDWGRQARGRARSVGAEDAPVIERRGADGMLGRARSRSDPDVRPEDSSPCGRGSGHPGRGRAPPLRRPDRDGRPSCQEAG